jgi:hypothetical protein
MGNVSTENSDTEETGYQAVRTLPSPALFPDRRSKSYSPQQCESEDFGNCQTFDNLIEEKVNREINLPAVDVAITGIDSPPNFPVRLKNSLKKTAELNPFVQYGDATIRFLRNVDGSLRLFKEGSMLGEEDAPEDYEKAVVKAMVSRKYIEEYVVILPVTRRMVEETADLDLYLARAAWSWRG